jgi:hypothetical protein
MGVAGQVVDVQVEQRRAAQPLCRGLQLGQVVRQVGAVEIDPDEAVVRRAVRHGVGKAHAAGGEFDDVHPGAPVMK